jgi:flagellar biosynthesis/type III secretory pathway protein FliH
MVRKAVLVGVVGVLASFLAFALAWSIPARAQDRKEEDPPRPSVQERPTKADGVEDLLGKLKAIEDQEDELERAERETAALLKEKLREQRERAKRLGVEEGDDPPAARCVSARR